MSDDKTVVDFGARAALERSRRTGFLLTELDGAACKVIFDAAHIDCRLDGDGDCVVRDTPDADGQWPVMIDHDRLVFDEERLEPRTIVKMVRRFQFVVRNGITRFDTEKIF
jgi:hypothetical protein